MEMSGLARRSRFLALSHHLQQVLLKDPPTILQLLVCLQHETLQRPYQTPRLLRWLQVIEQHVCVLVRLIRQPQQRLRFHQVATNVSPWFLRLVEQDRCRPTPLQCCPWRYQFDRMQALTMM